MKMLDMGATASGRVCDTEQWFGHNPPYVRPARYVTGTVCGIYPAAPNVVDVELATGERVSIRRTR